MAKKESRGKRDKRFAEVARRCSSRIAFIQALCREYLRQNAPDIYARFEKEAYRRFPLIPRVGRVATAESIEAILNGDTNDK